MPFTIRSLRLPFVKISQSPKAGRSFTWHAGPWKYDTRTGQHTLKLPGTVTYKSRTRTQKKAAARQRATRRAAERAAWDAHFAGNTPAPTLGSTPKKKATGKRTPAGSAQPAPKGHLSSVTHPATRAATGSAAGSAGRAVRVTGGPGLGLSFADYMDTQLCRKPTAGGGICQNMASSCPPGTHADGAAPASLERTRTDRLRRWNEETEAARAQLRAQGYPIPGEESQTPVTAVGQRIAVCGARTRDGSPCSNTGRCPHHSRQQ
jgi:hypothetical protein